VAANSRLCWASFLKASQSKALQKNALNHQSKGPVAIATGNAVIHASRWSEKLLSGTLSKINFLLAGWRILNGDSASLVYLSENTFQELMVDARHARFT
jgi:hypothetical protein